MDNNLSIIAKFADAETSLHGSAPTGKRAFGAVARAFIAAGVALSIGLSVAAAYPQRDARYIPEQYQRVQVTTAMVDGFEAAHASDAKAKAALITGSGQDACFFSSLTAPADPYQIVKVMPCADVEGLNTKVLKMLHDHAEVMVGRQVARMDKGSNSNDAQAVENTRRAGMALAFISSELKYAVQKGIVVVQSFEDAQSWSHHQNRIEAAHHNRQVANIYDFRAY